jgi:5'(3')-deoxyribonucleotidase
MRIGIDMDGVIADAVSKLIDNANKRFFLKIKEEDVGERGVQQAVINHLPDSYVKMRFTSPEEVKPLIYSKGFFLSLKEYDGAIEAVKHLYKMRNEISFITKVIDWETSPGEKFQWINKRFSDIAYNFICVDKMSTKARVDVDLIIDDDPRVIKTFPRKKILIKRPWNRRFRKRTKEKDFIEVDSMKEAVEQIEVLMREK